MAPFKVISFDCDGVLFDSKRANEEYYGRLARDFGRDRLTPDEIEFVHTHTVFQSVDHVFRETPEVIEAVHKVRAERGYGPFVKLMIPAPGIYDCLAELGRRYRVTVFTNRTDTIHMVLREHKMDHLFEHVVCATDVDRPKPHPDGLYKTMELTGARAEELVYVGDAATDQQAAEAAGASFIAYRNPALIEAEPLHDFADLPRLLKKLGN